MWYDYTKICKECICRDCVYKSGFMCTANSWDAKSSCASCGLTLRSIAAIKDCKAYKKIGSVIEPEREWDDYTI